jgi:hypothetical protein
MPTFKFWADELQKILDEHPEAEDNIRTVGDLVKCNGCNWRVSVLYVRANTREEAIKLLVSGDAGLCGDCYADLLVESD